MLRPLINALVEFFNQAGMQQGEVPILDAVKIRREIFKLSYQRDLFGLNFKADAFEAYDFLLTSIHSWTYHSKRMGEGDLGAIPELKKQ